MSSLLKLDSSRGQRSSQRRQASPGRQVPPQRRQVPPQRRQASPGRQVPAQRRQASPGRQVPPPGRQASPGRQVAPEPSSELKWLNNEIAKLDSRYTELIKGYRTTYPDLVKFTKDKHNIINVALDIDRKLGRELYTNYYRYELPEIKKHAIRSIQLYGYDGESEPSRTLDRNWLANATEMVNARFGENFEY